MKKQQRLFIILGVFALIILVGFSEVFSLMRVGAPANSSTAVAVSTSAAATPLVFSGVSAFKHVEMQMSLGPRPSGSDANTKTAFYIQDELKRLGWQTEVQTFVYKEVTVRNVVGKAGKGPTVIVGAHFDTRRRADQDRTNPTAPVLGASDGASGVAVLLELARTLDVKNLKYEVWLAFFDAEDNGGLDGWEWIVGSTHFANSLTIQPKAMILADMVGDADQQIYYDANSDPTLSKELFSIAAQLGYEKHFIPQAKYSMYDDHTPFMQRGIPAVDLIDFDYPFWHTTQDTTDKVSAASLERVGRVIETYLEK